MWCSQFYPAPPNMQFGRYVLLSAAATLSTATARAAFVPNQYQYGASRTVRTVPSSFAATLPSVVPKQKGRRRIDDAVVTEAITLELATAASPSCILPLLMDLAKEENLEAAESAEKLVLQLLQENGDAITSKHYMIVMDAWCRVGCIEKAEALLEQIVSPAAPGRLLFHILIRAHARAGNLVQAVQLLERMELTKNHHHHSNDNAQPITADYNPLLAGYAREGRVAEAEALLQRMVERGNQECAPDAYSYNHLLEALTHGQGQEEAGERAEEILNILERDFYGKAGPVVFNKVLKVWKNSSNPNAAARSAAILKRMVDLRIADHISYTSYIATLAAHGTVESAQRASDICDTMLQTYTSGQNVEVKPNSQTWNTVLSAWVRCGDAKKAEQVLQRMEEFAEPDMAPNVVSYSTVMDGWAKSSQVDSLERIERIFERMKAVHAAGNASARPNFWTYVTLIHMYAKQRSTASAQKAEDLIFVMYREYEQGSSDLKPNTQLVTAVMEAWQKSGATKGAEKAEALLDWMILVYEDENDRDLAPNEYSFSSVIAAWGRSRSLGKSVKARRVLNKMIQLHESGRLSACPNTICYTAVINSCAYCENDDMDKREALRIAIGTYKDLETSKYGSPNHVTYSNLLTALRNLLPTSRKRSVAVKDVFESAVKNGCVDEMLVQRVKSALSSDELQTFFPSLSGDVKLDQLPNEWRRNVKFARPYHSSQFSRIHSGKWETLG